MYVFTLRNGNRKRGQVLYSVYSESLLTDRVRKIANRIFLGEFKIDEYSFIDLEKNGRLLKTIYALDDGTFSDCDFDSMENYCRDLEG